MAERDWLRPLVETLLEHLLLVSLARDLSSQAPDVDLALTGDQSTVTQAARDRLDLDVLEVCGLWLRLLARLLSLGLAC